MPTTEQKFARLFAGRSDAMGVGGDTVTCVRTDVTFGDYASHLGGEVKPIGIYSMVPKDGQWLCRWGAWDCDVYSEAKAAKSANPSFDFETEAEAHDCAVALVEALDLLGITGWIERTRSGGRHVWVFAKEPVTCAVMRRALMVACRVADAPTREVNPKNETQPKPEVLGNFVRLPYHGALATTPGNGETQVFINRFGETLHLSYVVEQAWKKRAEREILQGAAQLYRPSAAERREVVVGAVDMEQMGDLINRINGLGFVILRDGPDGDRSGGLYKLAGCCKRSDFTPAEAMTVLTFADDAWEKFVGRADRELRLMQIVERVYSRDDE